MTFPKNKKEMIVKELLKEELENLQEELEINKKNLKEKETEYFRRALKAEFKIFQIGRVEADYSGAHQVQKEIDSIKEDMEALMVKIEKFIEFKKKKEQEL